MILITNLHNPSGALTDEDTLRRIGKSAERVGAKVVVNEAYLDALFDHRPQSAACLGDHFVITNSLTKAYGLSALRCGWILCEPGLADQMWKLNDLFGQLQPHPIERLSVLAFDHLDRIAARARTLLQTNRSAVERFLAGRDDLEMETPRCAHGTTVFPKLRSGDGRRILRASARPLRNERGAGAFLRDAGAFPHRTGRRHGHDSGGAGAAEECAR